MANRRTVHAQERAEALPVRLLHRTMPAWVQRFSKSVEGTGSLEHGDSSGEIFWMPYPTFLGFFYETFPEMMPQPSNKQGGSGESVAQRAGEVNADDGAGNGCTARRYREILMSYSLFMSNLE